MRKTDNPYFGYVIKESRKTGLIHADFQLSVLRRLSKLGLSPDVYSLGESWHRPVSLNIHGKTYVSALAVHKSDALETGKKYLRFFSLKSKNRFLLNGKEVPVSLVEPYLILSKKPAWKPVFICISLENVAELRIRELIVQRRDS